jgi:hypothetical protein
LGITSGTLYAMKNIDESTRLTIELAKLLIETMRSMNKPWRRAFVRFKMTDEDNWGCSGSYETSDGVELFSAMRNGKQLFDHVNEIGPLLRDATSNSGNKWCIFLLTVESNLTYEIQFEKSDVDRWKITKLDGAIGLPNGVQ